MAICLRGLVLSTVLLVGAASAVTVDEATAGKAVGAWRARRGTLGLRMGREVGNVRRVEGRGAAFHVVRFEGGGYVIAPTDTKVRPVILFSDGADFDESPENPMWDLLGDEFAGRDKVEANGGQRTTQTPPDSSPEREWAELLSGDEEKREASLPTVDDIRVGALVPTSWRQGNVDGEPCYNYYTPNNYPCGCVATALAQIMRTFEFPLSTTEIRKYDSYDCKVDGEKVTLTTQGGFYEWDKMPYNPHRTGISQEGRQMIGKLTSDLGIVLGMYYKPDSSGASTTCAGPVLKLMGYANAVVQRDGTGRTGQADDFRRLFISNFDAGLPVQIGLSDHSIVGDGYGFNGGRLYYHLNFGWSGSVAWYCPPDDMEGYKVFYSVVYNIYTTMEGKAGREIASGRVLGEDGRPASGVTVSAARLDAPDTVVASARTNDKGIYALFVPAGRYRISVDCIHEDGGGRTFGSVDANVLESVSRTLYVTTEGLPKGTSSDTPKPVVGNAAECDIQLESETFAPEATVRVGEAVIGADFASLRVPVTAQAVRYATAASLQVVITLTPSDGGAASVANFTLAGDLDTHVFEPTFGGLKPGVSYEIRARVTAGDAAVTADADGAVAARKVAWIAESAATFPNAAWSVGNTGASVSNGWIRLAKNLEDPDCALTYTATGGAEQAEIAMRVRMSAGLDLDELAAYMPDSAGLSLVTLGGGTNRLAVWGSGRWNATDLALDEYEDCEAKVSIDRTRGRVGYRVRRANGAWNAFGPYEIAEGGEPVRKVEFAGIMSVATLDGVRYDKNLVRDGTGAEYADFTAALAGGATGVLSPLWKSTWTLGKGPADFTVSDPGGLVTYAGDATVVSNDLGGGVAHVYYAEMSPADVGAGAEKYLKATVDLGLAKPITDASTVKIGDFLVTEGQMSFSVSVDDVEVAKAAIGDFVQVAATLTGKPEDWTKPDDGDIRFELDESGHGRIVVTPNAGGTHGFARVRIPDVSSKD